MPEMIRSCRSVVSLQRQAEVDWAGDLAHIMDPDTGETLEARIFVGVTIYKSAPICGSGYG